VQFLWSFSSCVFLSLVGFFGHLQFYVFLS
jgi:hypothetical protein